MWDQVNGCLHDTLQLFGIGMVALGQAGCECRRFTLGNLPLDRLAECCLLLRKARTDIHDALVEIFLGRTDRAVPVDVPGNFLADVGIGCGFGTVSQHTSFIQCLDPHLPVFPTHHRDRVVDFFLGRRLEVKILYHFLVGIYAALAGISDEAVLSEFGGAGFGTFKPALAELAVEKLSPITQEMRRLLDDPAEIDAALAKGAEKANAVAAPIIEEVRRVVGFWQV